VLREGLSVLKMPVETLPEGWVVAAVVAALAIVTMLMWAQAFLLHRRYTGPYTLLEASAQDKWRRAVAIAFWETAPVLAAGMLVAILDVRTNHLMLYPLLGLGSWLVLFSLTLQVSRQRMDFRLKRYIALDRAIQSDGSGERVRRLVRRLPRWLDTVEIQEFAERGYSVRMPATDPAPTQEGHAAAVMADEAAPPPLEGQTAPPPSEDASSAPRPPIPL